MLERQGFGCRVVADPDALLDALADGLPAVAVVDARAPEEEELLLLGLLDRRHPDVARLVLHLGGARLHSRMGDEEQRWEPSELLGPTPALPSPEELERSVRWLCAGATLSALRPEPGLA